MKRNAFFVILVAVLLLSAVSVLYVFADEKINDSDELIISVETTQNSNYDEKSDNAAVTYEALPFEFEIKEAYSSHREVCTDKDALDEYMHQYITESIRYAWKQNITTEDLEGYGYNESLYHLYVNKLREWEMKFEPTETEKIEYKERFIEYYISIQATPDDEADREKAEYYLNEYHKENISIDEAMEKSGAINYIELFADKKDTLHSILSESHLLGWYKTPNGVG